jgi:hypothetical protein
MESVGLCNQTWPQNDTNVWITAMAIYRRKATVIASLSSWDILEATDLSAPEAQYINSVDLFSALDTILTPTRNAGSDQNSSAYMRTEDLYRFLNFSSMPNAEASSLPVQYLRNLLVLPLYLCNPVTASGTGSITAQQTNLPVENQLTAADATKVTRAVPGQQTVWIYIASAGTILLITFIVILIFSPVDISKTSSFPIADFLMLSRADGTAASFNSFKHDDIFAFVKTPGNNKEILNCAGKFRLYPNQREESVVH